MSWQTGCVTFAVSKVATLTWTENVVGWWEVDPCCGTARVNSDSSDCHCLNAAVAPRFTHTQTNEILCFNRLYVCTFHETLVPKSLFTRIAEVYILPTTRILNRLKNSARHDSRGKIFGYLCRKSGCHPVSYTHLTLPTNREV